ncbi:hypothetical protein JJB07_00285 [Tumebacillus sp. ITR2]|uniref:Transposase n=1 Tax=Tumebacillus amylolyticus TaxID=2801339 RepID=A0ABS1J470_9BACL|nr:hypothetical protein [Tumebacillus amylolyticus]MBL0385067.1 hypothetical protein [Tumebacillus amylolyticus]
MSALQTRKVKVHVGSKRPHPVKADESLKTLFHLSSRPIVDLLNGLFGEAFNPESAQVESLNTEFIDGEMDAMYADSRIRVTTEQETKEFHIEFQTKNDAMMIIRMFEYGFQAAKGGSQKVEEGIVIRFPPQLVIYLEHGPLRTDEISCIVQFPPYEAGNQYEYRVPVKRFWEFTDEDFTGDLYALIPFQVFTFRKVISSIVQDQGLSDQEKKLFVHRELARLKECIEQSHEYILAVHRQRKITEDDVNKMSTVIYNLSRHLYNKFEPYYESFFVEVEQMVKSMIDMKLLKQAKEVAMNEGRMLGIKEGKSEGLKEGKLQGLMEGKLQGLMEGKTQGLMEGKHEMLLSQFSQRNFLDDQMRAFILGVSDEEMIQKLSSLILTASSKQEILQGIQAE